MDKHLSLNMENVREQAYSQEELKKQIKAQYDLFSNAPYLEADKNRLMQIYKTQLFLLVEASKHFTTNPEYLKTVLQCIQYTFGEAYINECYRHEIQFPEELYEALERVCYRPVQNYFSYMLSGLEVYGAEGFYESPVFEEFADDVNLVLKIFQPYSDMYAEIPEKLNLEEVERLSKQAEPVMKEKLMSKDFRELLNNIIFPQ